MSARKEAPEKRAPRKKAPRKRALGRGLDALIRPTASVAQAATLPVGSLRPNRYQPRRSFDDASLEELAASIRSQGVMQPILVTPADGDGYTIVAGERRWRAARLAGLAEVPVTVRENVDEREMLEMALVENLQRSDLNPVEEAEAYRRLAESFGLGQEEIAKRVGKGRSTVANALRLLRLPEGVLELLRTGELTAGQARPLLALEDDGERLRLARRAAGGGLSARRLEAIAAGGGESPRKTKQPDPDTRQAAERLTRRLQTRVDIVRRGSGGAVRITFHSEEELMRLFELLMSSGRRS